MALRLNHDLPELPGADAGGLLILLGEAARDAWHWWRVASGGEAVSGPHRHVPGEDAPWNEEETARVVALVPAALSPVRITPRGDMPVAQALAAMRLDPPGLKASLSDMHIAVGTGPDGDAVLSCAVACRDMDCWLAELAAAGLDPIAMVPAALILPQALGGAVVTARIGDQALARTAEAAFAGEPELAAALAPGYERRDIAPDELASLMAQCFDAPQLDLRQGIYAMPRVSYFRLPDWRQLSRMTAILALLVFAVLLVETVKLNFDASMREEAALEAAQVQFPGAIDLASAEAQVRGELLRRGSGGVAFADSAPAVFAAMQPEPSVRLRNLNWRSDGTLALRAAAPDSDALNRFLAALQRDGWKVTVPPETAPDATGAAIADITVRAP